MESHFTCHFIFEKDIYFAQVSYIDTGPLPQFQVTQSDQLLIDNYGKEQIFTLEHGIFTWNAHETPLYDGYLKTAIAESLLDYFKEKTS